MRCGCLESSIALTCATILQHVGQSWSRTDSRTASDKAHSVQACQASVCYPISEPWRNVPILPASISRRTGRGISTESEP